MFAVPSCIIEAIWDQFQVLIPAVTDRHPLSCHRPRVADRVVFDKLVQVLVLGAAVRVGRGHHLLGHHHQTPTRRVDRRGDRHCPRLSAEALRGIAVPGGGTWSSGASAGASNSAIWPSATPQAPRTTAPSH